MIKLLVSITLFLTTFLYADGSKQDKTYIFKAKGEFAEELKALMEKHSKEGRVEIEEVHKKKRDFNRKNRSVIGSIFGDDDLRGDLAYGKRIYEKTCYRCHGEKANKSSYPTARVLNTLSKKEIYEALFSYKSDANYGKNTKIIMHEQVSAMGTDEMVSVSAYIDSLSPNKKASLSATRPAEDMDEPSQQGTYLK